MTRAAEDRVLVLLRHGHAEQGLGRTDADRALTSRGHEESAEAGAWLHEHGIGADLVLCSPSTRTRQTCDDIFRAGCAETTVHHDGRVYNASPEALLDVLREADENADVVLVVGHAPGLPGLASLLADGQGSTEAHELLAQGFPSGAFAVMGYAGHWRDLALTEARLDRFVVPPHDD